MRFSAPDCTDTRDDDDEFNDDDVVMVDGGGRGFTPLHPKLAVIPTAKVVHRMGFV